MFSFLNSRVKLYRMSRAVKREILRRAYFIKYPPTPFGNYPGTAAAVTGTAAAQFATKNEPTESNG